MHALLYLFVGRLFLISGFPLNWGEMMEYWCEIFIVVLLKKEMSLDFWWMMLLSYGYGIGFCQLCMQGREQVEQSFEKFPISANCWMSGHIS